MVEFKFHTKTFCNDVHDSHNFNGCFYLWTHGSGVRSWTRRSLNDMHKFEWSQKDESRTKQANSSNACRKTKGCLVAFTE